MLETEVGSTKLHSVEKLRKNEWIELMNEWMNERSNERKIYSCVVSTYQHNIIINIIVITFFYLPNVILKIYIDFTWWENQNYVESSEKLIQI